MHRNHGDFEAGERGARELLVPASGAGQRLDVFLRSALPELSRRAIVDAIAAGQVRVQDARALPSTRLQQGERVTLALPYPSEAALADPSAALSIAYEDASLVMVDKPAGMPCHPLRAGERGTLASALLARFPEMAYFGYSKREPGLVHRLDTLSSGLVLCARSERVFQALRAQLERGEIDKRYFALCVGVPAFGPGLGEHHAWLLARGPRVRVALSEQAAPRGARPITTEVLRVRESGPFTQVELRAHRAARHQIRAHLAALGYPLVGDAPYGGANVPGLSRHCLHASAITLVHPETRQRIVARAGLPAELRSLLPAGHAPLEP